MSEGSIAQVLDGSARWSLTHGDMLAVLATLPENSLDGCPTDPPYHLTTASRNGSPRTNDPAKPFGRHAIGSRGFMGRTWDGGNIAMRPETWAEVLRVLKPGAYVAAFGGTRTYHRIACAIEDAGFEIRDSLLSFGVAYLYGSGFPKSKNLGGGVGTALKPSFEPIVLARKPLDGTTEQNFAKWGTGGLNIDACRVAHAGEAKQIARGGVGGYNGHAGADYELGEGREYTDEGRWPPNLVFTHDARCVCRGTTEVPANPTWDTPNRATEPSAFTGSDVSKVRHANGRDGEPSADRRYDDKGSTNFAPTPGARRDDTESVDVWECVEGCPVRELALQSGERAGSGGVFTRSGGNALNCSVDGSMRESQQPTSTGVDSAARYFPQFEWTELDDVTPFLYCAKAGRSERDRGLDHFRPRTAAEATDSEDGQARLNSPRTGAGRTGGARNVHPTIKPVELLRWLVRLVTPPGGIVLDPFAGAASCGIAALLEGYRYVGVELNDSDEEPYVSIGRARLHHVEGLEFVPRESLRAATAPAQRSLFREVGS